MGMALQKHYSSTRLSRLLYCRTQLQRAEKSKNSSEDIPHDSAESSKKFTHKSTGKKSACEDTTTAEKCFFCDKPAPDRESLIRKASTFMLQ